MPRITQTILRAVGGSLLAFSFLFLSASNAFALSVNPAIQDVEIDPGKAETRNIVVENDEGVTATYVVSIQKFLPLGDSGQQQFLDPSDTEGLPNWMFVERPEIKLAPGQKANLPVAIRVPSDAKGGGYYAALFLTKKQESAESVSMMPRLGILFFVRVNGPSIEKISLQDFALDGQGSYENLPVGFRVALSNDGNVHLSPQGTIVIRNLFGSTVERVPVNPEAGKILPQSGRVWLAAWSKGQPKIDKGFFNGLIRELSNFALGPHTAVLELSGRGFQNDVTASVSFSVWPWRTGVALVGLLVGIVVLFFVFRKLAIASATAKSNASK
jgi:hypothetical protein